MRGESLGISKLETTSSNIPPISNQCNFLMLCVRNQQGGGSNTHYLEYFLSFQGKSDGFWFDLTKNFSTACSFWHMHFNKNFIDRLCPVSPRSFARNNSTFFVEVGRHIAFTIFPLYHCLLLVGAVFIKSPLRNIL